MQEQSLTPIPYKERRAYLFSMLEELADNAVAIIPAHSELIRNDDVHFKFRQESSFYYLTGFEEPDSIAVLKTVKGRREYILFVRPKDLKKEIWTGYRAGVEGAVVKYGADKSFTVDEFESQLLHLLQGSERVFYDFHKTNNTNGVEGLDHKVLRVLNRYRQGLGRTGRGLVPLHSLHEMIGEMRLFKSPEEVERMRKAAQISAFAHKEAMAICRPGLYEYQIEALVEYHFRNLGCGRHGYPSIVATGSNATILHYVENNAQLKDGDLFLIDAGGEYDYYSADITRTYPVTGKWSKPQAELYDIVLSVQKECINMARPGQTLTAIHQFAVEELSAAMLSLGFLKGTKQKLIETLDYKRYYPHGTGHLLGMDVHDIGLYQLNGEPRKLEAGMVFTVEPGFYVLYDDMQVPEEYRGIGIRVEDDILVTATGHDVLTKDVPKERAEMSAIIGTKKV